MPATVGTAVVFGYQTTTDGITITGIAGMLMQSGDQSAEADKEQVRDGTGDVASETYYDRRHTATLEFVVKGTGLANAITNRTLANLQAGTIIVISACASQPDLIQTNWVVQSSRDSGSNTTSARITLQLERRAKITAVAAA